VHFSSRRTVFADEMRVTPINPIIIQNRSSFSLKGLAPLLTPTNLLQYIYNIGVVGVEELSPVFLQLIFTPINQLGQTPMTARFEP